MKAVVTTSWDDGVEEDLRVHERLRRRGMRGTFYLPSACRLGVRGILRLAREQEVGAHSITHPHLTRLPSAGVAAQAWGSKQLLELLTGKPVPMFAYPYGEHDARVRRLVRQAGFRGARTYEGGALEAPRDPFRMGITLGLQAPGLTRDLQFALASATFDHVRLHGGVWHLAGHARELEERRMWDLLDEILRYVGRRRGVAYLGNAAMLSLT